MSVGRLLALATSAAFAVAFLVAGCELSPERLARADRAAQVRAVVLAYYEGVRGGRPDRGWDLIHPEERQLIFANDRATYIALAERADWSSFRIEVGEPTADDELGTFYFIPLRVPGGPNSVPAFLLQHGNYSLVGFTRPGQGSTEATVAVRFDASGVPGIWAGGG